MGKSIETIWKEGFLHNDALVAPKLNNLYNQKSKQLIQKIKKTYRIDHFSVIPIAFLLAFLFIYYGYVTLAIYIMSLLLALFLFNRKKLKDIENISIEDNSYQFLTSYRRSVKKLASFYTILLSIAGPIVTLPAYWLYFRSDSVYHKFIEATPSLHIFLFIAVLVLILSAMMYLIVKFSYKLVYGKMLTKMDELIADMDELKR